MKLVYFHYSLPYSIRPIHFDELGNTLPTHKKSNVFGLCVCIHPSTYFLSVYKVPTIACQMSKPLDKKQLAMIIKNLHGLTI